MRKLPILLAAAALATLIAVGATRSSKSAITRNLDVFTSLYKALQTNYVDSIDADKSMKTAIDAMLGEIDPYTEYTPESEQDEFLTISTGEYGGIGSYINQRPEGGVQVTEPRFGTPSQRAGLRPGDVFLVIDGDSVAKSPSSEVSKKLRGQAGTDVKVTVRRPYVEDSILDFTITREKIDVDPVPYYGVARDGIGYIQITTFNDKTFSQTRDALLDLKKTEDTM